MQHPVKTKTFDEPMRDYNYDHNFELGINVAITRIATLFLADSLDLPDILTFSR